MPGRLPTSRSEERLLPSPSLRTQMGGSRFVNPIQSPLRTKPGRRLRAVESLRTAAGGCSARFGRLPIISHAPGSGALYLSTTSTAALLPFGNGTWRACVTAK